MLCKTVNAMSFAEYSYESEFESYESSFFPIPIDRQKQTSDGCGASSDGICIPNAACRFISAGSVFLLPAIQKGSKRK